MAVSGSSQAVIGLTGVESQVAGMRLFAERFIRADLPSNISGEQLELMHNDLEAITAISRKNPAAMIKVLSAACKHDFATAHRVANDIGLDEENLKRCGGGQVGIALGIIVILVIVALASDSGGGSAPEPVGPNPEDGGTG
jgi:hypothetical protein